MNHAITFWQLLFGIVMLIGLASVALGALELFAAGMSDNPSAGDDAGRRGCLTALVGVVMVLVALYGCVRA